MGMGARATCRDVAYAIVQDACQQAGPRMLGYGSAPLRGNLISLGATCAMWATVGTRSLQRGKKRRSTTWKGCYEASCCRTVSGVCCTRPMSSIRPMC